MNEPLTIFVRSTAYPLTNCILTMNPKKFNITGTFAFNGTLPTATEDFAWGTCFMDYTFTTINASEKDGQVLFHGTGVIANDS